MKIRGHIIRNSLSILCATGMLLIPISAEAALSQTDKDTYLALFDAEYYYDTYPDVAAACGMDEEALFEHFISIGALEGRNASADFNPMAYRQCNEDLRSVYGNNLAAYCTHYLSYGKAEGRNGSGEGIAVMPDPAVMLSAFEELGSYTTAYNAKIPRAKNVQLAAQRINGVIVQPGESFSYSRTILPRTSANGYVNAPVIVNKEYTSGMGGGICQVSSTLYAAMLTAGLPATERHPHSLPVSYLPEGMDATISGTALDLRFDNIYTHPLMIQASAVDGELTVSLVLVPSDLP